MSIAHLEKMKKIQSTLLYYIDNEYEDELHYQFLIKLFNDQNIVYYYFEFKILLRFICSISNNHHRPPEFFSKIDRILLFFKDDIRYYFTNTELFNIFKSNKRILLFLIKENMLVIDNYVSSKLLSDKYINAKYPHYFLPEIKPLLSIEKVPDIPKEIPPSFESDRMIAENHHELSRMIRTDSIDEFISYSNRANLSLSKVKIKPSIFETNLFLIDKEPTLIEYAAFLGSIQIFMFLRMKKVKLAPSLWLYAIHSNNGEIIRHLEENNLTPDDSTYDKCLEESIRCNHNDIFFYIEDNLLRTIDFKISLNVALSGFKSYNYECFPTDFVNKIMFYNKEFHHAAKKNRYEIIFLLLSFLGIDIEPTFFKGNSKLTHISIDIAKTAKDDVFDGCINLIRLVSDPLLSNAPINHLIISTSRTTIEECNVNREGDVKHVLISPDTSLTAIETHIFKGCSKLTQVTIPPSIDSIEQSSFEGCSSLTQIVIPPSVVYIGDSAFYGCSSLTSITIPSSISSIESYTFCGCTSLTQINIPCSIVRIGDSAFRGCSSLTKFSIPSSMTMIEPYTFYGCSSLTEIEIPSSIIRIGYCAFKRCTSLSKISIPPSVVKIESYSFYRCSSLTEFVIPSSITKIESYTFYGCSSLTQITIPSSVTSIESNAFFVCSSLTQISIPSSVTSIESYTFCGCASLKDINIPPFITAIGEDAFFKCSSLAQITIPSSVTKIESFTFFECSSLKEIFIPTSVTSIGNNAFRDCSSLVKVTIPSSIKLIEHHVFYGCSSLKEILIPSSVTQIEDHAFYGCSSLKKLSIPTSVTEIGDEALFKCTSLIQITIPYKIQVSRIGIDSNIIVTLI